MKAYHFLRNDMRAGSGNEPAWKIGETRKVDGEIELCHRGYHSYKSWYDALKYAPGAMACIVKTGGKTLKDTDKQVSSERTLIDARDATKVLMEFDIDCAERVLPNFEKFLPNDDRPRKAIEAARKFNQGLITKEELSAARSAAELAAWSAARSAAWSAAELAAWSAARSAAWSAAELAAWSAARSAAELAEIRWQKQHLNKLMNELFKESN